MPLKRPHRVSPGEVRIAREGGTAVRIDGREFDMADFGRLLAARPGSGMRIAFVDGDHVDCRPDIVIREPDGERGDGP